MENKTILVTGASGGIGNVLCDYLASKSYNLILVARDNQKLSQLKSDLSQKYQVNIDTLSIDFGNEKSFEILSSLKGKTIDGLVMMPPQASATSECFPETSEWQALFNKSFIGPVNFIKACTPFLKKAERSKVVIISGISSAQVLSHYATSNVLRTAWLGQAKTMAFALAKDNIHVNTLSLGGVMTDKYKARVETRAKDAGMDFNDFLQKDTENVPLRKYAAPLDVAKAAEMLLGPGSDHITGNNIICDGGFTRAY